MTYVATFGPRCHPRLVEIGTSDGVSLGPGATRQLASSPPVVVKPMRCAAASVRAPECSKCAALCTEIGGTRRLPYTRVALRVICVVRNIETRVRIFSGANVADVARYTRTGRGGAGRVKKVGTSHAVSGPRCSAQRDAIGKAQPEGKSINQYGAYMPTY